MTVEAATYISDLNTSYPEAGSSYADVDNHIRLVKSTVKTTFSAVTGEVTASHTELNLLDGATGTVRTSTSAPIAGEMVLMREVTPTAVSAIDFVDGANGVTLSSAYDEFMFVVRGINCSTTGSLRLDFSTNGGSTFGVAGCQAQRTSIVAGTQTVAADNLTYMQPGAGVAVTSTVAADGQYGFIRLVRLASATDIFSVHTDLIWNGGTTAAFVRGVADAAAAINAIRLTWSTGNFGAMGSIKFYGRKT